MRFKLIVNSTKSNLKMLNYISIFAEIAAIIGAFPILYKGWGCFRKNSSRPKIIWGEFDFPSSTRADFYLKVASKNPIENVKLYLKPKSLKPSNFRVRVSTFFQHLGHEHLQEIKTRESNFEKHTEIEFDLPTAGIYRLVIESKGGAVGSLLPHNCEIIDLRHSEAKIRCKPNRFLQILSNQKFEV